MPEQALSGRRLRDPAVSTWLRLARVYQKIDRLSAQHLRSWGLSVAQFDVLAHVGAAEGLSQQELADSLLVTKGNICQMLDRLEATGLLTRQREGRTNRLYLTGEGRALFQRVVPSQEHMIKQQLEVLAGEQKTLLRLLRVLDRAM